MEYWKIINLLDNIPNQSSQFRTKNWVKINDDSWGTYNKDSQLRFKTSVLRSSLCDYSNVYILVKGTITSAQETAAASNVAKENGILNNCVPFTSGISRINNTQVEYAQHVDVVMWTCNLIEYCGNYSNFYGNIVEMNQL